MKSKTTLLLVLTGLLLCGCDGGQSSSAPEKLPNLPATVNIEKDGFFQMEAEKTDLSNWKKSSDNSDITVADEYAEGGYYVAAAPNSASSSGQLTFYLYLTKIFTLSFEASYVQVEKYKGNEYDMASIYSLRIDEENELTCKIGENKLEARSDVTDWGLIGYNEVTLPKGKHTFTLSVPADSSKGCPNIDYFSIYAKAADSYTPVMPDNDLHNLVVYKYLQDDSTNSKAYAVGKAAYSTPRGVKLDFSKDVSLAESYVCEVSSTKDFTESRILQTKNSFAYLRNVKLGEKLFFRGGYTEADLANAKVQEMTVADNAPRMIDIEGADNFRDIGGYASSLVPGAKINQGLYFRGAQPNDMTAEGQRVCVEDLGIKVEIDLRDSYNCKGPYFKAYTKVTNPVEYHQVSIPSSTESTRWEKFETEYKTVFELMANADNKPIYLHCTHGADRTGIMSYFLLCVCGASYEDMARDYMMTNFSQHDERKLESEFNQWYSKLDTYGTSLSKAEQAKQHLMTKGLSESTIEHLRSIFVPGYQPVA